MANTDQDYERVLLVKPTVYVHKIPPLVSASRGFKATDWNLSEPDWTGRLRLISKGEKLFLLIEDANSGALYCEAPILTYPSPQVQPVSDSSRYFVVKVVSDTGRTALIGIGFGDRADSFDLVVAIQDHFKTLGTENKEKLDNENRPKLDLSLKGDIRVSLNIGGGGGGGVNRPRIAKTTESADPSKPFFLPPPPSSKRK